jgi:hemerythrin-like domain-containing protein
MLMKITDGLLGEHAVFYAQFKHLRSALDNGGRAADWKAYVALIVSALEPHAEIEEEILFKALEGHLPAEAGPLAVMKAEHDEIRATLKRILEGSDATPLRADILHFLEVVHSHFAKEEQVLYPLAEQIDPPGLLERLGEPYCAARGLLAIK